MEDNEYNKPKGRAFDRYGLEWSCPGEPHGFDVESIRTVGSTKGHKRRVKATKTFTSKGR